MHLLLFVFKFSMLKIGIKSFKVCRKCLNAFWPSDMDSVRCESDEKKTLILFKKASKPSFDSFIFLWQIFQTLGLKKLIKFIICFKSFKVKL